jgi:hypothetical protein
MQVCIELEHRETGFVERAYDKYFDGLDDGHVEGGIIIFIILILFLIFYIRSADSSFN